MDYSLSDSDIKRLAPSLNVMVYSDLANMSPLDVLSKLPLVILYQKTPTDGHWTLLHKVGDDLEFFDSYGFKPDEEFKFLPKQPHYIAKLLYILHSNGYRIHYNQYEFQEDKPGINTCGRHVVARHIFGRGKSIDDYKTFLDMASMAIGGNYDQVVTKLTG